MIPNILIEKLSKPFPPEAVGSIPGKSYLTSIKAMYIIERLNEVLGYGGWTIEHSAVYTPEQEMQKGFILVRGFLSIPKYEYKSIVQYGGHITGGKGTDPADGYKSAVTDLTSKCASYLHVGIQIFKGQEMPPVEPEPKKKVFTPQEIADKCFKLTEKKDVENLVKMSDWIASDKCKFSKDEKNNLRVSIDNYITNMEEK